MIFRLDRFFFDEKDLFTLLFGLFLGASYLWEIPLAPFRLASLLVIFIFLVVTRSIKSSLSYEGYFLLSLVGLLLSLVLSAYGLVIYLFIASLIYMKWARV